MANGINKRKMTCIQHTMQDLKYNLSFSQMNILLGIAKNQGLTIVDIAYELDLPYGKIHQTLHRLGNGGPLCPSQAYQIVGLNLVKKRRYKRGDRRIRRLYLTPKGFKFIKRITRNKR